MFKTKRKFMELIATIFFVGYTPLMPGTAGSLVTVVLFFFLPQFSLIQSLVLWTVLLVVGVYTSNVMIKALKQKDPGCAVIDEVLGMSIALFMVPKSIFHYAVAFGLFRFFDIVKPFPVGFVERKISGGWGVMLDDVVAGAMTVVLMWLIFR